MMAKTSGVLGVIACLGIKISWSECVSLVVKRNLFIIISFGCSPVSSRSPEPLRWQTQRSCPVSGSRSSIEPGSSTRPRRPKAPLGARARRQVGADCKAARQNTYVKPVGRRNRANTESVEARRAERGRKLTLAPGARLCFVHCRVQHHPCREDHSWTRDLQDW